MPIALPSAECPVSERRQNTARREKKTAGAHVRGAAHPPHRQTEATVHIHKMGERYRVVVVEARNVKQVKSALEALHCFDRSMKISPHPQNGMFQIPVLLKEEQQKISSVETELRKTLPGIQFIIERVIGDVQGGTGNAGKLETALLNIIGDAKRVQVLMKTFPKKYSVYPPLLLFSPKSFETCEWQELLSALNSKDSERDMLWSAVLADFSTPTHSLTHVAINKPIPESENVIRSPTQLTILHGNFDNFWCHTVQNGIYQTWMPMHTMFSRGNIKEKARILSSSESYENITPQRDVFDLYAGIGYFTLSYLKRGARRLFCWEINPYSVEGLVRGVKKNGFGDAYVIKKGEIVQLQRVLDTRCVVFLESNEFCLHRIRELEKQVTTMTESSPLLNISHVNLGLLPTSTYSWPYACALLDNYADGTSWIHVHENIGIAELPTFMDNANEKLQSMLTSKTISPVWLEKVKTFAPDVYHIVGDFRVDNK